MSERRACRLLGQWRGTQRYIQTQRDEEDALTRAIVQLASQYGRYGYHRITAVLQRAGWNVGQDRVQRIWRREGLRVPAKQKPRGRLWLNDGSCMRLRPALILNLHPALGALRNTWIEADLCNWKRGLSIKGLHEPFDISSVWRNSNAGCDSELSGYAESGSGAQLGSSESRRDNGSQTAVSLAAYPEWRAGRIAAGKRILKPSHNICHHNCARNELASDGHRLV